MGDQRGGAGSTKMGYDLNAREELIRTYTEKEIELKDKLDALKQQNK